MKKNIYTYITWPNVFVWAINHPRYLPKKKTLCRGNLLVKCKIVIIKPVLGKKLKKTKSTFIAGLWNFYLYFLEIETQEIAGKKIKVALP